VSKYQKIIELADGRKKVVTVNDEPSMTQQQFKEMSDINRIMKKYHKGEMVNYLNRRPGVYGDFSKMPSYSDALQIVIDAQESFMTLPSDVRKRFDNDPAKVIEFISDSKNYDEAINLGLVPKKVIKEEPKNANATNANANNG